VTGLQLLGCRVAQGYFFSHPLPAREFNELLTAHFAPAVAAVPGEPVPPGLREVPPDLCDGPFGPERPGRVARPPGMPAVRRVRTRSLPRRP
jgi:hypothetical protein